MTDVPRSYSEDIDARRRRYLFWMAVRTVCFGLAIVLVLVLNGTARVIAFFVVAIPAIFLPMLTVVFANAGREPSGGRFDTYDPASDELERRDSDGRGSTGYDAADSDSARREHQHPSASGEPTDRHG